MSIHEKDSAADSEATMSCFYNKKLSEWVSSFLTTHQHVKVL